VSTSDRRIDSSKRVQLADGDLYDDNNNGRPRTFSLSGEIKDDEGVVRRVGWLGSTCTPRRETYGEMFCLSEEARSIRCSLERGSSHVHSNRLH
jgi:hypothetical protein